MAGETKEHIASNEAVFRRINEGIERGQWPGEEATEVGFRCECARLGCTHVIELSVTTYEQVRADSRRFVVAVGHELPEAETVLERHDGYLVVQKRDQAAERATATDPRR